MVSNLVYSNFSNLILSLLVPFLAGRVIWHIKHKLVRIIFALILNGVYEFNSLFHFFNFMPYTLEWDLSRISILNIISVMSMILGKSSGFYSSKKYMDWLTKLREHKLRKRIRIALKGMTRVNTFDNGIYV